MEKILIIGSNGQLGTELTESLADIHGEGNVFAADIHVRSTVSRVQFFKLDVLDTSALADIVNRCQITQVYQLAAMLSATGEKFPLRAWNLNMQGLINTLELARSSSITRVFWPSSIAAFGPNTPRQETPQLAVMDPNTMYGISKQAGERICEYYHLKFGVDVRSIRYPGIISYASPPGGGTTDYAIDIFQAAKNHQIFNCFLDADTKLPMIYMPDAIRATLELMSAPAKSIQIRSSYNVAGVSFSPAEIAQAIKAVQPDFKINYAPDFRQAIANSWPQSLDDAAARQDWGWKAQYELAHIVQEMMRNIPAQWPSTSSTMGHRAAA
jgi:nucleoside-diphosphate-sugar epimerase